MKAAGRVLRLQLAVAYWQTALGQKPSATEIGQSLQCGQTDWVYEADQNAPPAAIYPTSNASRPVERAGRCADLQAANVALSLYLSNDKSDVVALIKMPRLRSGQYGRKVAFCGQITGAK